MPGPAPKPTALKKLEGNPGKRALPKDEPNHAVPKRQPPPPTHLNKEAKKHFKRIAARLIKVRVFTENDVENLALWCAAYADIVEADKHIQQEGHVVKTYGTVKDDEGNYVNVVIGSKANPWVAILQKAWERLKSLNAEFGMTPASRTRIQALPEEKKGDDWDDF